MWINKIWEPHKNCWGLWCGLLGCCLGCRSHIVECQFKSWSYTFNPAFCQSTQEGAGDEPHAWIPVTWEIWKEFWSPGFDLIQPSCCRHVSIWKWTREWKFSLSWSLCLFPSLSAFLSLSLPTALSLHFHSLLASLLSPSHSILNQSTNNFKDMMLINTAQ